MDETPLRWKILDMAMRGRLLLQEKEFVDKGADNKKLSVNGRPDDGVVHKENAVFCSEDNLHYEKLLEGRSVCMEDKLPYQAPKSWRWYRLSELVNLHTGKSLKIRQLTSLEPYPVYGGNGMNGTYSDYNVEADTIIIGRVGNYCGSVYKTDSKAWVTDNALIVTVIQPHILDIDFFVEALKFLKLGECSCSTAQPVISAKNILPLRISLPPLYEQIKIIQIYRTMLSYIHVIETNTEQMFECISRAKTKILELAIRGKLISQNSADEPASVCLEQINIERRTSKKHLTNRYLKQETLIFRDKNNSYYEKTGNQVRCIDQEIPFDIPKSWIFVRLKQLGCIVSGGTPKTTVPEYWNGDIPWLTPADFSGYKEMYISKGQRSITKAGLDASSAKLLPAGSILYSSRAPIGYIAIAKNPVCTSQGFKSIIPYNTAMSPYLYYCLKARTNNIILRATGTTFKEISGSEIAETLIPLPPLCEQQRICHKIQQLNDFITQMEVFKQE